MRSDDIIKGLGDAVFEALTGMFVNGEPPFKIPYAIQGDMWKFTVTDSRDEAINLIHDAIRDSTGGVWNRYGRTNLEIEKRTESPVCDSIDASEVLPQAKILGETGWRERVIPRHALLSDDGTGENHENL